MTPAPAGRRPAGAGVIQITASPLGLFQGTYRAQIRIASNAENSSEVIPVDFIVVRDSVSLSNPAPAPGIPLAQNSTNRFAADVNYALQSREAAYVALQLFDDNGIQRSRSLFTRVRAANSPGSVRIELSPFYVPSNSPNARLFLKG